MKTSIHFLLYLAQFLKKLKCIQTKVVEKLTPFHIQ